MKTAAKVFIWIAIIFSFYLIFPLVVGIIALRKLSRSTDIKEIHNFGIVTLFFCSFLGGLFMMHISEADISTANSAIIKYETIKHSSDESTTEPSKKIINTSRLFVWTIAILQLICLILSLIYSDIFVLIIIIIILVNIVCIAIPTILFICNKQSVDKKCNIAFIITLATQTIMLGFVAALFQFNYIYPAFLVIFILSIALTLATVCLNHTTLKHTTKRKIVMSKLEVKLKEIQKLLENNIITQSEYEKMRNGIISEYH